jgi:hypothetical protein
MRNPKSVLIEIDGEKHHLVPINDEAFVCIPEKCSMYKWCYEGYGNAYKRFCEKFYKRTKNINYHFVDSDSDSGT